MRGSLNALMVFVWPGLSSRPSIIAAVLIVSGTFGTAGAATITVDDNHDYASAEVISDSDASGRTLRKALQQCERRCPDLHGLQHGKRRRRRS